MGCSDGYDLQALLKGITPGSVHPPADFGVVIAGERYAIPRPGMVPNLPGALIGSPKSPNNSLGDLIAPLSKAIPGCPEPIHHVQKIVRLEPGLCANQSTVEEGESKNRSIATE